MLPMPLQLRVASAVRSRSRRIHHCESTRPRHMPLVSAIVIETMGISRRKSTTGCLCRVRSAATRYGWSSPRVWRRIKAGPHASRSGRRRWRAILVFCSASLMPPTDGWEPALWLRRLPHRRRLLRRCREAQDLHVYAWSQPFQRKRAVPFHAAKRQQPHTCLPGLPRRAGAVVRRRLHRQPLSKERAAVVLSRWVLRLGGMWEGRRLVGAR